MRAPSDLDPDLATSWLGLIDDLGTTLWAGDLRSRLEHHCSLLGVRLVPDAADADTVVITASELEVIGGLSDTTTVVCLATNRLRTRPSGGNAAGRIPPTFLPRVVSATGVDGVRRGEVFGLLPSVAEPRVALSLRSPVARKLVLRALELHVRGLRLVLIRLLVAMGGLGWFAHPGWLVVAHGRGRADSARVTGQFSYAQKGEVTRFLGEPPELIERSGPPADHLAQEAARIQELQGTDFASFVPRVVTSPDPQRGLLTTRLRGTPLAPKNLSDDQLLHWTEQAAKTLVLLQAATEDEHGTVLVHGDFWLGNLTVEGDDVVGVFDWESAHRGSRREDREFLTKSLTSYLDRDDAFAEQIRTAAERGFREWSADQPSPTERS